MSLTKSDLQQIGKVVNKRLEFKLEEKLEPIRSPLQGIGRVIDKHLTQKLKPIIKEIKYIRKTVDIVVKNYDEGDVALDRRVRKIEEHLRLTNQPAHFKSIFNWGFNSRPATPVPSRYWHRSLSGCEYNHILAV